MAACNYDAPNGVKSLLYAQLEQQYGSDIATKAWMWIRSDQFGQKYIVSDTGAWQGNYDDLVSHAKSLGGDLVSTLQILMEITYHIPTDENGEPKAEWVAEQLKLGMPKSSPAPAVKKDEKPVFTDTGLFGYAQKGGSRLSFEEALGRVKMMYEYAADHPSEQIDLTSIKATGVLRKNRTGFTPIEIANIFAQMPIPPNVRFSEEFQELIENTASMQIAGIDFRDVPLLTYDETNVALARDESYIPIRDKNGNKTGKTFTSEQQVSIINGIVSEVWQYYNEDPNIKLRQTLGKDGVIYQSMYDRMLWYSTGGDRAISELENTRRAENLQLVLNSWGDVVERSLYKLASLGLSAKNNKVAGELVASLLNEDDVNEDVAAMDVIESGTTTEDIDLESGKGKALESYFDSTFELDPRDTATARIKLFLASSQEAEVGMEREPERVVLYFNDPQVRSRILGTTKETEGVNLGRKKTFVRESSTDFFQDEFGEPEPGDQFITNIEGKDFRITFRRYLSEEDFNTETGDISTDSERQQLLGMALHEDGVDVAGELEKGFPPAVFDIEEWKPNPKKIQTKENFIGFEELVDFELLFQELLEITADKPNTYEGFLQAIKDEGKNFRPSLTLLTKRLERQPDSLKREFVSVLSKQYQEYGILLFSRSRSGALRMNNINANSGSAVQSIIKQWRENQKNSPIITVDAAGHKLVNRELAESLLARVKAIGDEVKAGRYPDRDTVIRPLVQELFEANGIILPEAAMDYLLEETVAATKGTGFAKALHQQFAFGDKGPVGMFAIFTQSLVGNVTEDSTDESEEGVDRGQDSESASRFLLNNNPLYKENAIMRTLARLVYRFGPRTAAGSHKNSEGKTVYSYGAKTHLSVTINKLKEVGELVPGRTDRVNTFRDILLAGTFLGKRNWILSELKAGNIKNNFGVQYVDGLKDSSKSKAKGIVRTGMSSREQLLFAMGQFQNGGRWNANYLSLTHSDKTTTPLFLNVPKFQVKYEPGKGVVLPKKTMEAVINVAMGEYDRIVYHSSVKGQTRNDSFNKGGNLFYFIPQLNYDYLKQMQKEARISPEEISRLWKEDGTIQTNVNPQALNELIKKVFVQFFLNPEIRDLQQQFSDDGFDKLTLIDERYFFKKLNDAGMISSHGLGRDEATDEEIIPKISDIKVYAKGDKGELLGEIPAEEAMKQMMQYAAADFIVNNFLFHTNMSAIVYGDPALNFKPGKNDKLDFQKVESSMKEYQKRLAKDIAPGADPTWDEGPSETYRTITLQDDERVHDYLEGLAKYKGAEINASDAQEFTTVREHLYVMKAMGMLETDVYNEMIGIIDQAIADPNNKDNYYKFTDPRHTSVVMQIMKPVAVSHNFGEVPGVDTIQYVKSSSMPLYPPLTEIFQLDGLRLIMEGDGTKDTHIPRANFISAKKEGAAKGKGVPAFDKEGNFIADPASAEWKTNLQTLSREGFRIQQQVPYDELKEAIQTGSQMNKLFTQGIQEIQDFVVRGMEGTLTGAELRAEKERVRKELIKLQLEEFRNKVGIDPQTGKADLTKLLGMMLHEAESRNYPQNDIIMIKRRIERAQADGSTIEDLAIPLFFNPSAAKFESLLMSMIRKIGKVYVPGKSFIQASAAGFKFKQKKTWEELSTEDRAGIVWVKGEDGKPLFDGKELRTMTRNEGKVTPAQVLLPFNFVIGEELVNVRDFVKKGDDGVDYIDTDRVPRELLNIIGFRIPTQGHNSMLPIEIVGFVPSNMGDTIIVPAAITMQMGSDFDVDKLYSYRRGYKHENGRFVPYDNAGETADNLLTRYYDLMWSVLTHPDMYEKVMQPLDKPDLKTEAARAAALGNPYVIKPFFSIKRQLDDFLSQKDAKVMVGISSLAVVWQAQTEDKDLRVMKSEKIENEDGEDEIIEKPYGITFRPEGEDQERMAYIMSGEGKAEFHFGTNKAGKRVPADVQWKVSATGTEKTYVDSVTGEALEYSDTELRTKIDDLVSLQSEFLDHAKNRTIDQLNINLLTINAALAMSVLSDKAGSKPSLKHVSLLLRQEGIVRLVKELSRSKDSLSTEYDPNMMKELINRMVDEYLESASQFGGQTYTRKDLTDLGYMTLDVSIMKADLKNINAKDPDYWLNQAAYLLNFERLNEIGEAKAQVQKIWNQDPGGPGRNVLSALDILAKEQNLGGSIIRGTENLAGSEMDYIHSVELSTARDAYTEILPYQGLLPMVQDIMKLMGRVSLGVDLQNDIIRDFRSFVFAQPTLGLSQDPHVDRLRLLYGTSSAKSLATRVWEAQQTSNNYFLKRLQPQQADVPNTPSYILFQSSRASALDDQENASAFLELLTSEDETLRRLGEDLVRYAYITGGRGVGSFVNHIPVDYLISLPFAAELRRINQTLAMEAGAGEHLPGDIPNHLDIPAFIEQWIQHNPGQMSKVTLELAQLFGTVPKEATALGERFELPPISVEVKNSALNGLLTKDDAGMDVYPDYLSFFDRESGTWKLYKRVSFTEYNRIDTLGSSYTTEYRSGNGERARSILTENRALIKQRNKFKAEQTRPEQKVSRTNGPITEYGLQEDKLLDVSSTIFTLGMLSKEKAADEHVRILAGIMKDLVSGTKTEYPVSIKFATKMELGVQNGYGYALGPDVVINARNSDLNDYSLFGTVVNHEVIHAVTSRFHNSAKSLRAKYGDAQAAYDKVLEIYNEVYYSVMAKVIDAGYTEQQMRGFIKGDPKPADASELTSLYYTVHNIDEFITSVLTKKDLQLFMNGNKSEYRDDTLLGRLLEALSNFIRALASSLGVPVAKGSQLEVALRRSLRFFETIQDSNMKLENGTDHIYNEYTANREIVTEEQAKQIAAKISEDYPHIVATYVKDPQTGLYKMEIGYTKDRPRFFSAADLLADDEMEITEATPTDRVYARVMEQIADIRSTLAKSERTPAVMNQRKLLSDLKGLAEQMKATKDLNYITVVGKAHLLWARKIGEQYLDKGLAVSINELMTAYKMIGQWTNIVEFVYGKGTTDTTAVYDQGLSDIQTMAGRLHSLYTESIMPKVITEEAAKGGRELNATNFQFITDMNGAEGLFLDISRAKDKVVQELAIALQNAHRNYLEDGQRLVSRLEGYTTRFEQVAKAKGLTKEELGRKLFQDGTHWGLADRYTSSFYRWKASIRTKLEKAIDAANSSTSDPLAKAALIRLAYDRFWASLNKNAGYIDIRQVFTDSADFKTDAKAIAYKAKMVAEYGEELADALLLEAQNKFKTYLKDKQDYFEMWDNQVLDGYMTQTEADTQKGQWDIEHSPIHKLKTAEGASVKTSEKYLLMVPHKKAVDIQGESFFSAKYDQIMGDKDLKELYSQTRDFMDEFTSNLPFYMDDKLGPNFLPAIHKENVLTLSQLPDYAKSMPQKMLQMLAAGEYEETMQDRKKDIPIMYTKDPLADVPRPLPLPGNANVTPEQWAAYEKAKAEKLKSYTMDLPRVLELFGLMSTHYKHMSGARDNVNMVQEVLRNVDHKLKSGLIQKDGPDGRKVTLQGDLRNTLDSVQYAIDTLMYKRTKNLQGKLGEVHRLKNKDEIVRKIADIKIEMQKANADLRAGLIDGLEYDAIRTRVNEELNKYEVYKLYASKAGDILITWTQLKALSYNPVSAFANLSFGLISGWVHAEGGEDFTTKSYKRAMGIMMNSTGKMLRLNKIAGESGGMHVTARKITSIMDRLGIMGELSETSTEASNVAKSKASLKRTLSPFQMLRTGDYFVKGLNTVAILLEQKVSVTEADGSTKEIPVWDAFDDNGNWKYADKTWQSENVTEQTNMQKLRNKVVAVNKIIMGNQDKSSPIFAKKNILFRLLGQFRLSWFSEGIASRFEEEREDAQLGRVRKGRYRTYADLGPIQSVMTIAKQTLGSLPFVKIDAFKGTRIEHSNVDKANMRRNFSEIAWFMLLWGSVMMLRSLAMGDDEDKKKGLNRFLINLAVRNYQDIALYANPKVFDQVLGTSAPALSSIKDVMNFVHATGKVLTDDEYEYEQWLLKLARAGFIPQTTLFAKYKTLTEKDLDSLAR